MKVVVIGSSNIDMVAQVSHLPAPGETVGDANFMQSLGGKRSEGTKRNRHTIGRRRSTSKCMAECLGRQR